MSAASEPPIEPSFEPSIEDWARRALQRWPNVPHLYGWLRLDRRGRWLIRGELITRPQIIETIAANYAFDARGCWYFQNGPQRGYMALDAAPLILSAPADGDALDTHLAKPAGKVSRVALDEGGGLWMVTQRGPGWLTDRDLDWALARISTIDGTNLDEAMAQALAQPSGSATRLQLTLDGAAIPIERLDERDVPAHFYFVTEPTASTP